MGFRLTEKEDLEAVMMIIREAQGSLKEAGVDQWQEGYPTETQILKDIERGESYVWEENDEIAGTVMFTFSSEPSYKVIKAGQWLTDEKIYGTIHRIAVKKSWRQQGIAGKMLGALEAECREKGVFSLRADTHRDNEPMRTWLVKNSFLHCGSINLYITGAPREAYEKELLREAD